MTWVTVERNERKAISTDGTQIAVEKVGSGSPLLLVRGTGADHTRWSAVAPKLAEYFTIYGFDRRGHGPVSWRQHILFREDYAPALLMAQTRML